MQFDDERPKLKLIGSVGSRVQGAVMKTAVVAVGAVTLASAFVVSIAFFAVAASATLVVGGYLWWKTRHFRRQLRAEMQGRVPTPDTSGDVLEGEVLSRSETDEERRPR
jgi:hypothetical protein